MTVSFHSQRAAILFNFDLELEETLKLLEDANSKMTESLASYSKYSPEALENMKAQQVTEKGGRIK